MLASTRALSEGRQGWGGGGVSAHLGEGMCIACSTRSGMTEGPGMESCSRPWASDAMAALPVKVQLAGCGENGREAIDFVPICRGEL